MFAYKSKSLLWYFKLGIMEEKKKGKKERNYIADVSCLTNRFFYMQTLSLIHKTVFLQIANVTDLMACRIFWKLGQYSYFVTPFVLYINGKGVFSSQAFRGEWTLEKELVFR